MTQATSQQTINPSNQTEFIDSKTLAERWNLPESWISSQARNRGLDVIPHLRFGKFVRFPWGSPELEDWAKRRLFTQRTEPRRKYNRRKSK